MSQKIKEAFDNGTNSQGKKWEDYDTIVCPDGQIIDMQQLLVEQQRAAAALTHLLPSLGGFVSKMRFIYTFRVDTQATDGYNIFINPQFTFNLDLTGKTFVLAHEIMHCLLNHLRRAEELGHPQRKANVAADYECNITLSDNLGLIKYDTIKKLGCLIDKKYLNWGYEKIYASNPPDPSNKSMNNKDEQDQAQQQQGQSGQGGSGSGQGGQEKLDPDYIKGWNEAVKDYETGKLSIN